MTVREIFRIEDIPVCQNRMFETQMAALACTKSDIVLVQDNETGLVFNRAFDANLVAYNGDYQNEQAFSRVFQDHLTRVGEIFDRHFRGKSLIEIGCGKGYFLEQLQNLGYEVVGIDPAYDGTNPSILKSCFKPGMGLTADVVVLRHVLEHIVDPIGFLASIADANAGRGDIYVEVPCLDWILCHRAWFDIFYEHVNYFRLSDLAQLFGTVKDAGHLFGGQYLYVVADLSTLHSSPHCLKSEPVRFPVNFLASLEEAAFAGSEGQRRRAIWGAGAKGVIFVYHMSKAGNRIDLAIDINPAKQRKFLAGSGLRVLSPDQAMHYLKPSDDIFVMNSNYLDEIITQTNNQFNYIRIEKA